MCIRNNAGQSAIDVRRTQELRMIDAQLPVAVVVFKPSAEPDMRIEAIGASPPSAKCAECVGPGPTARKEKERARAPVVARHE